MATLPVAVSRAKRFAANLRSLISGTGLTQREFAFKVEVPYNWIRKSCNDGIARPHPRNEKSLKAICDFFHMDRIDTLWRKRILAVALKDEDLADQHREFVDTLNWLLKDFPDDHNVAEVRRVICEVVARILHPNTPKHDAVAEDQPKPKLQGTMPRAERFKANLRHLVNSTGVTQKAIAERLGIPYIWLRKACCNGVGQLHPKNADHIQKICEFFRLNDAKCLWNRNLNTKKLQSIDDFVGEQRALVADLVWLLKEHSDSPDPKVKSNVAEVRRVITAVANHLYVSEDTPSSTLDGPRQQSLSPETKKTLKRQFPIEQSARSSPSTPPIESASFSFESSRVVPKVIKNRKDDSYVDDIDELDERIDGADKENDLFAIDFEASYDNFLLELEIEPTPDAINEANRISRIAGAILDDLPDSLREWLDYKMIRSTVERMVFAKVANDKIVRHLEAERLTAEVIFRLPESVSLAFHEEWLPNFVRDRIADGVSLERLLAELVEISEDRDRISNPEVLKRRKRIRRRKIT